MHIRALRACRLRPGGGLGPLARPLRHLRRQRDRMRRRGERRRPLPLGAGAAVPLLSVLRRRVADGAARVPGWAHRGGGGGGVVSGEEGQAEGSARRVQHRPLSAKVRQRMFTCLLVVELPAAPLGPIRKRPPLVVLHISILTPVSHPPLCGRNHVPFVVFEAELVTVLAFFTALGIMFQLLLARLEKKFLLISSLAAFCLRLSGQSALLVALPPSAASWNHVLYV